MTYQPGQSGNPAGRPKGARGKATILAEGLVQGEAEAIIRAAKSGDRSAVRVCLDRVAPRPRDRPITFELPPLQSAASVLSALADIAAAVSCGDLTPAEADDVSKPLDRYLRTFEHVEFEQRIARLEREVGTPATEGNQNGHSAHGSPDGQSSPGDQGAEADQDDPLGSYNFGDAP